MTKKVIAIIMTIICLAVASAQEGRSPVLEKGDTPLKETQPTDKIQETVIVDLSDLLRNRFNFIEDLTGKALKDKQGLCAIHHHELKEAQVSIIYGLVPVSPFPPAIVKVSFPNAITEVEGGCTVMSVREAKVLQCEKCLASKKRWAKKNSKGASAKL
jgi:hypothetical protein